MDIAEADNNLLLSCTSAKKEKLITLDITSYNRRMALNLLYQAYRLGFDVIKVKYKDKPQLNTIQSLIPSLLGFELVEDKNGVCVLQNIAEPEKEKFEVILRRLFLQILKLSEEVAEKCSKEVAANCSKANLTGDNINPTKEQIDKLTNYLRRTIIRYKPAGDKSVLLYSMVAQMSLISHAYFYLQDYLTARKKKPHHTITAHLLAVNKMLRDYYESFYRGDKELMHQIGQQKDKLFQENDALLEKMHGSDNVALAYIREIIRLIQSCTTYGIGYHL